MEELSVLEELARVFVEDGHRLVDFVFESRDALDEAACLLAWFGPPTVAQFFDGRCNVGGQSLGSRVG